MTRARHAGPFLPVAALYEANGRRGALRPGLYPVTRRRRLAGPAFPLLCGPGSNLEIHRALYAAKAGEVLVIGQTRPSLHALVGDLICDAAIVRRLGGLVIDGYVRDLADLEKLDLPIFCRGGSALGPSKIGAAGAGAKTRIRLCGVPIRRGDWMAGDPDGLVVLRRERRDEIFQRARERLKREKVIRQRLVRRKERLADILGLKL